jgi:hypothetical protein
MRGTRMVLVAAVVSAVDVLLSANAAAAAPLERVFVFSKGFTVPAPLGGR